MRCKAAELDLLVLAPGHLRPDRVAVGTLVHVRTGLFAGFVGKVTANEGEDRWVVSQVLPEGIA